MWKLLKTNFIIEKSSKKNIFVFIFVALFVLGLTIYLENSDEGNLEIEKTFEHHNLSSALSQFPVAQATGQGNNMFENLNQQQRLVSLQRAATKFEKPDMFVNAAIDLANLRNQAFEIEGYDKIANYLPSVSDNHLESIFYEKLKSLEIPMFQDSLSFFQFIIFLFGILGSIWFIFLAFYTSGIMIDDFRHTSLIKGYPIPFAQYVAAKGISTMSFILLIIAELFICSLPLIYFRGLGEGSYPIAVFTGSFETYSIPQYISVCLLYMVCIGIFVILLSIILNVFLKNMYLTLFAQLLMYVLPILFPRMVSLFPYNPFNYMNFASVLSGQSLNLDHPVELNMTIGLIIIIVSIALMVVAIKLFLSTGKLKRV